jgi:hypothetical protein
MCHNPPIVARIATKRKAGAAAPGGSIWIYTDLPPLGLAGVDVTQLSVFFREGHHAANALPNDGGTARAAAPGLALHAGPNIAVEPNVTGQKRRAPSTRAPGAPQIAGTILKLCRFAFKMLRRTFKTLLTMQGGALEQGGGFGLEYLRGGAARFDEVFFTVHFLNLACRLLQFRTRRQEVSGAVLASKIIVSSLHTVKYFTKTQRVGIEARKTTARAFKKGRGDLLFRAPSPNPADFKQVGAINSVVGAVNGVVVVEQG